MTDAHLDPKIPARAPAEDIAAARAALEARKWSIQEFVVACLRTLRENADGLLGMVADQRPEPKKRGRPKKNAPPA